MRQLFDVFEIWHKRAAWGCKTVQTRRMSSTRTARKKVKNI